MLVYLRVCQELFKYAWSITIEHVQPEKGNLLDNDNEKDFFLKQTFFTLVEQVVRKSNAKADLIFLLEVAFFHWRKHKNFSPVGFLKKMEIANSPLSSLRAELHSGSPS